MEAYLASNTWDIILTDEEIIELEKGERLEGNIVRGMTDHGKNIPSRVTIKTGELEEKISDEYKIIGMDDGGVEMLWSNGYFRSREYASEINFYSKSLVEGYQKH